MKLKEYQEIAVDDCKLTEENLQSKNLELSYIKSKWINYHVTESLTYKKMMAEYDILNKNKYVYYSYNYDLTLDRKTVNDIFIPGDEDIKDAKLQNELQKHKILFIEETLKTLVGMGFQIKSHIDYVKFQAGE